MMDLSRVRLSSALHQCLYVRSVDAATSHSTFNAAVEEEHDRSKQSTSLASDNLHANLLQNTGFNLHQRRLLQATASISNASTGLQLLQLSGMPGGMQPTRLLACNTGLQVHKEPQMADPCASMLTLPCCADVIALDLDLPAGASEADIQAAASAKLASGGCCGYPITELSHFGSQSVQDGQ
jgi:hypothetical protein